MDIVHPPITTIPFVQRRVVQWGECDPAGIVYTPRFLDYALEAVDTWLGKFIGVDWYRLNTERGLGMPVVHTSLDFKSPVRPGDTLDLELLIARLGRSSIEFRVTGISAPEREVFTSTVVCALIDPERFEATAFAPEYRERIEAYVRACEGEREC